MVLSSIIEDTGETFFWTSHEHCMVLCGYDESTDEAKVYKSLDKLEALISHNESDITTWLPLEYSLQLSYG